jgi:hypothetical protein
MKGPNEKPLGLDMDFGDALRRFIGTRPAEVADNVAAAKEKRGPPTQSPPVKVDDKPPKRPAKPLD